MKYLIYCLIFITSITAHGSTFTLGDGITWKNICTGIHDDLDRKSAIASCTMFILGYQAGAIEPSKASKAPISFCRDFNPNTLPHEFVVFVSSDRKYEKMNVLTVMLEFTKRYRCGI